MTRDAIETVLLNSIKANAVLGAIPEIKKGMLKLRTYDCLEAISIRMKVSDNMSWQHSFAYVYIYIPLIQFNDSGVIYLRENTSRIAVLEKAARDMFTKRTIKIIDSKTLHYKADEFWSEREEETFSTVITVKLRVTNENFI